MSPQEFWLLLNDAAPEPTIGGMKQSTFERLSRMLDA